MKDRIYMGPIIEQRWGETDDEREQVIEKERKEGESERETDAKTQKDRDAERYTQMHIHKWETWRDTTGRNPQVHYWSIYPTCVHTTK